MKHISEYLRMIGRIHADQSGVGFLGAICGALALGAVVLAGYYSINYVWEYHNSQNNIRSLKEMCEMRTARVAQMNKQVEDADPAAPPPYRIRFEEMLKYDACKNYQRALTDEKSYLEEQRGKGTSTYVSLPLIGKHMVEIPLKALEGMEWAREGNQTEYEKQKWAESQALRGKGWSTTPRAGDDLSQAMAASEDDFILKTLAKQREDLKPVIEFLRDGGNLDDQSAIARFLKANEAYKDMSFDQFSKMKDVFVDILSRFMNEYDKEGETPQNIKDLMAKILLEHGATPSVDMTKYTRCSIGINYQGPNASERRVEFSARGSFSSGNQFSGKGDEDSWVDFRDYHASGNITDVVVVASSNDLRNSRLLSLTAHWTRVFKDALGGSEEYTLKLREIPYFSSDPGYIRYWLGVGPHGDTISEPRLKNVLVSLIRKDTTGKGKVTTTSNYVLTKCQVTFSER